MNCLCDMQGREGVDCVDCDDDRVGGILCVDCVECVGIANDGQHQANAVDVQNEIGIKHDEPEVQSQFRKGQPHYSKSGEAFFSPHTPVSSQEEVQTSQPECDPPATPLQPLPQPGSPPVFSPPGAKDNVVGTHVPASQDSSVGEYLEETQLPSSQFGSPDKSVGIKHAEPQELDSNHPAPPAQDHDQASHDNPREASMAHRRGLLQTCTVAQLKRMLWGYSQSGLKADLIERIIALEYPLEDFNSEPEDKVDVPNHVDQAPKRSRT